MLTEFVDAGTTWVVNQFFPYRAWTAYLDAPRTVDHLAVVDFCPCLADRVGVWGCLELSHGIGGTSAAEV